MNLVKGKNIVASLKIGVVYYPFFCAKSIQLRLEQDLIEVTSVNSGSDREYEPGMSSQDLVCSGVHILDNTGSKISANYLRTNIRRNTQTVRVTQTDDDGNIYIDEFLAVIKIVDINRETSGYGQCSAELKIKGAVSSTTVIPPNPEGVGVIYKSTTPGASTVSDAILSGKTILEVDREGIEQDDVSPATPVGRQFKFAGTTITFDAAIPFNAGETVKVIYQS